jgi:hypothetical protein
MHDQVLAPSYVLIEMRVCRASTLKGPSGLVGEIYDGVFALGLVVRRMELRRGAGGGVDSARLGYGFANGVIARDLEERRVRLGALDILHGDDGLRAGPQVWHDREHDG